jgi:hypothetical protein
MIWFEDLKLSFHKTGCTEEDKLRFFNTYLSGNARLVYEGFNGDDIHTLNQAGSMMKGVFAIARDQQEWILHLRDLKRKPEENIRVYAYRTARVVRQAFPNADENTYNSLSIDYFTRGLPESINSYVIIRKPGTLDLAIRYAIIAEKNESHKVTTDKIHMKTPTAQVKMINQTEFEPYRNDINNRFKQVTEELKGFKTQIQDLKS